MNNLEMVNLDTYLNYLLIFVTNIANIDFKTWVQIRVLPGNGYLSSNSGEQ